MAHAYQPHDFTQLNPNDPYGRYNCSAYSLARLLDYATLGGLVGVTGQLVRALSSEPIPDKDSPGLSLPQMVEVAHHLRVELTDRSGSGWTALRTAVRDERRAALVQLDACRIPAAVRGWTPSYCPFPHAVTFDWWTTAGIHLYDPVTGHDRYVTEAQIKPAVVALASTCRFAVTRKVPWLE